ncbi:MAG: HAD-IIA family hydrolase [Oscillospiraceae bacterium]|nr:HAD-IIA family hydrolase [Oscillospiraceae bacterium]
MLRTLNDIKLFMLDMDGTFYLDNQLLPGALEFLHTAESQGISYLFLTNNSSKSNADYVQKLAAIGVKVTPQQIFTSGDATLSYMQHHYTEKEIVLVGTPSLQQQFTQAGYNVNAAHPCAVVLGFDTTLNYEKLTLLCNAVRSGLPYIATHPDFNCPVQGGYIPDIGATIAYVKAATGREPDVIIGKPNGYIAKAAADKFNLPLQQIAMVGDRLYTDIALGKCGVATVLVLSGETTAADLNASDIVPDFVYDNLAGLEKALKKA